MRSDLEDKVRDTIVRSLRLKKKPEELEADAPLFGGSLGLDSIDALELVLAIEREYGVRIQDDGVGREALRCVRGLVAFLEPRVGTDGPRPA
ncbi:MAG TPA: phosphopantetheine-binding protein [Planctomycetota bacterium]|jgi:acyl carrier protein|nr:phosphopantetheine-binding protein [Planctomycetota bacterium]